MARTSTIRLKVAENGIKIEVDVLKYTTFPSSGSLLDYNTSVQGNLFPRCALCARLHSLFLTVSSEKGLSKGLSGLSTRKKHGQAKLKDRSCWYEFAKIDR